MRHKTSEAIRKLTKLDSFTAKDAKLAGISPRTLQRLCVDGVVERLSRGVYEVADAPSTTDPSYAVLAKRVPNGILCLISALYHHNLTTEIPRSVYLAIPRNSTAPKIDFPQTWFFRMREKTYSLGVETKVINGVRMKIFSPEKTIADCFKFRNAIGLDVGIEAIRTYLQAKGARPSQLLPMARACRVEALVRRYLEALL